MNENTEIQAKAEVEQLQVYSLFDRDFSLAQKSIEVLKYLRNHHFENREIVLHLTAALLGDAIVSYSRPWLQSKGLTKKTHRLDHKKYVSPNLIAVHETMLEIRNREIAHTDLDMKNPSLSRYVTRAGMGVFPVGYHSTDFEHMFGQIGMVEELLVHVRGIVGTKILELSQRHDLGYKTGKNQPNL